MSPNSLEFSFLDKRVAHCHGIFPVDTQNVNCGSANGRAPLQNRTVPFKMLLPKVASWMK